MKIKTTLLIAVSLVLVWIFGDRTSYPNLQNVYEQEGNLEAYRASRGQQKRKRQLFSSLKEFMEWQLETRVAYKESLQLSSQVAGSPSVKTVRSMPEASGTIREYFELHSRDGMRIPGVLQYPEGAKNSPAVILVPGHTKPGESGLEQLIDEEESYHHAAATRLAKAGYVTIAIELRGFGILGVPNYPEHKIVAYNQLLKGSTYKALVLGDLLELLDYLETLDIVDSSRVGVAGASLGGELSVALGVVETSIKAIAFSSYVEAGVFKDFGANAKKQPHYCHLIPKVGSIMRKEDVFKLLAPRASIGIREVTHKEQYSSVVEELENTWRIYGREEAFEFVKVIGGSHGFYVEETIDFFRTHL